MSNRRSHLILVGLILTALAGVALLAIPSSPAHKKVTLGLDLQGGLEVVLKAKPPPGKTCDSACMDRSVSIMRSRVDKLGVSEPEIRKQGKDQIVIELAGVRDPAVAANLIGKTAQLELYDLETSLTGPSITATGNPVETTDLYGLLTKVKADAAKGEPSAYYAFGKSKTTPAGPANTKADAIRQAKDASFKEPITVLPVPEHMAVILCGPNEVVCPGNSPQNGNTAPPPRGDQNYYYLVKRDKGATGCCGIKGIPQMTGGDLKLSGTRQDFDPSTNEPV